MSAELRAAAHASTRFFAAIALIALAAVLSGCGGDEVQTTPTSLEKPALAVPEGSLAASSKKSGSTGSTSSTTTDSGDTSDSSSGTDTGTDTGGAGTGTDTGAGTDTGTDTGGADTGGAAPGN